MSNDTRWSTGIFDTRDIDTQGLIQKTKEGGTVCAIRDDRIDGGTVDVDPPGLVDPMRRPPRTVDPPRLVDPMRRPPCTVDPPRLVVPMRPPPRTVDPPRLIDPMRRPPRSIDILIGPFMVRDGLVNPSGLVHILGSIDPVGQMAGLVDPSSAVYPSGSIDNAGLVYPSGSVDIPRSIDPSGLVDPSGLIDVPCYVHDVGDVFFAAHHRLRRCGRAPAQPPLVLVGGPPIGPRWFIAEPVATTSRGV